jgi:hypothetical protein
MSLLKVAGTTASSGTLYVDDVFSTYLYTSNGSTQTITNGIDLAGNGGLVWIKNRSAAQNHYLSTTTLGIQNTLTSNNTGGLGISSDIVHSVTTTGFTAPYNFNIGENLASWTFRKAAKFFDVVTFTGNSGVQNIAHSLGVAPGMIIVKNLSSSIYNWAVYHRSLGNNSSLKLNTTDAAVSPISWWDTTDPTSTHFTVGPNSNVNGSAQYVAYLFAHDTSSTGIIQCGSWVSTGGGNQLISLGWEPQYFLIKGSTGVNDWRVIDSARGLSMTSQPYLSANTSSAETARSSDFSPTATGIIDNGGLSAGTYIYMAIRMPNKPPTLGTQVYSPAIYSGDGTSNRLISTYGFAPDLIIGMARNQTQRKFFWDRLRGASVAVDSTTTDAEYSTGTAISLSTNMLGVSVTDNGASYTNTTGYNYDDIGFKRAPGFFDEVCWTRTTTVATLNHNLTVVPQLIIKKDRSKAGTYWDVMINVSPYDYRYDIYLNDTQAISGPSGGIYWNAAPTATTFDVNMAFDGSSNGDTFVAYLFATLAGISKVGSYTGNGTGQVIACGFGAAGARFVLIKRTDATGNWYTFDSARGLTVGSSPYLLLNSTAAETTGNNGVYASTGGFTLGATAMTTTNISGASYIFLAVS